MGGMTISPLLDGLQVGDRLPNFERLDADRKPLIYYDRYCGEPLLLVLVLDPAAAAVDLLFAATDLEGQPDCVVMINADPNGAAAFRDARQTGLRVVADDGAIMSYIVGSRPPQAPVLTLLLDENAHLAERWWGWPGREALERRMPAGGGPSAGEGELRTAAAPVLILPRVFEPDFCRHLIEVYRRDNEPSGVLTMVDGRMVYQADDSTKIRREHRIAESGLLQAVEQRLARRVLPEIEWAFNYRITKYEAFKVVCYDAESGGYFRTHRDNNGPDTAHRRFAITLNLNSDEYEGGALRFPEYGPDRYKPPTGGAVVFSCSLAHAALPVERGTRYALVSFLYGDDTRIQRVEREDRVAVGRE